MSRDMVGNTFILLATRFVFSWAQIFMNFGKLKCDARISCAKRVQFFVKVSLFAFSVLFCQDGIHGSFWPFCISGISYHYSFRSQTRKNGSFSPRTAEKLLGCRKGVQCVRIVFVLDNFFCPPLKKGS